MARRQLELSNEVAAELAGAQDQILRTLEEHLDCAIYLRGNMVAFDRVIVVPSNGIEASVLKEQIALYLDATSLFYAFVQQK